MTHLSQANHLSAVRILLIDDDPVLRAGLGSCLRQVANLHLDYEADGVVDAIALLQSLPNDQWPTIILLNAELGQQPPAQRSLFKAARSLQAQYPSLPILLLGSSQDPSWLLGAEQAGIRGYWLKGSSVDQLVTAIQQVAGGKASWLGHGAIAAAMAQLLAESTRSRSPLAGLRQRLRLTGLRQIEETLRQIEQELRQANVAALDQAILAGRRRELRAARWLVNQMLANQTERQLQLSGNLPVLPAPVPSLPGSTRLARQVTAPPSPQVALWSTIAAQLTTPVYNATSVPLEIDILRPEQRRSLLQLVLAKLAQTLEQVKASQVTVEMVPSQCRAILTSLWQETLTDFLGKYYLLTVDGRSFNLVDRLVQDGAIVQAAILNNIPYTAELITHLVFQTPLMIDGVPHAPGTITAMQRAELLLNNLLIQVANAVIQPLLNRVGNVPEIQQAYYAQDLLSTREIERFRNNLSWTYRANRLVGEPIAIFESRYDLWQISEGLLRRTAIYAPRNQEFAQLRGIPLLVTLALELRDAIAPRVRAVISLVGSTAVYLLTEVIGRAIGLIGRGILKGIGNTLQDSPWPRTGERSRG